MESALLKPCDVAARLAVSVRTVRRLATNKKLRSYKVGAQCRFEPADVEAYLEEQASRLPAFQKPVKMTAKEQAALEARSRRNGLRK
jgi:excisionase family DNA binding protein